MISGMLERHIGAFFDCMLYFIVRGFENARHRAIRLAA